MQKAEKKEISDKSDNLDNFKGVLEKKIGNFIARLFELRDDNAGDDDTNWNRILGICLMELTMKDANNKDNIVFVSNKQLNTLFNNKTGANLSTQGINSLLSDIGFSKYSGRDSKRENRGYNIDFFSVCDIMIRQEFLKIEDIQNMVKKLSDLSEVSVSVDKINKWYTDNFRTTDNDNCPKQDLLSPKKNAIKTIQTIQNPNSPPCKEPISYMDSIDSIITQKPQDLLSKSANDAAKVAVASDAKEVIHCDFSMPNNKESIKSEQQKECVKCHKQIPFHPDFGKNDDDLGGWICWGCWNDNQKR